LDALRQVKRFVTWIGEIIAIVLAETYLKPVIDLLTGQQITPNTQLFGIIGLISIVIASILGFILAERSYKWLRKANLALHLQSITPSSPEDNRALIRKPLALIDVKDQTFRNQDIVMDGKKWTNCKFIGCNMMVETGEFTFIDCSTERCTIALDGRAWILARFMQSWWPQISLIDSNGQRIKMEKDSEGRYRESKT
jgi:hypothetical protein